MDTFTLIWTVICGFIALSAMAALAWVIRGQRRLNKRCKQLSIETKRNEFAIAEALLLPNHR